MTARVFRRTQRDPLASPVQLEFANDSAQSFFGLFDEVPTCDTDLSRLRELMKVAPNFSQFDRQARVSIHLKTLLGGYGDATVLQSAMFVKYRVFQSRRGRWSFFTGECGP